MKSPRVSIPWWPAGLPIVWRAHRSATRGWPDIAAGRNTLIAAPTGSGKTLAAFLVCIDDLVRRWLDGTLEDKTYVVYVSPLKALGNDIHRNLEVPLAELSARPRRLATHPARAGHGAHRRHARRRARRPCSPPAPYSGHHARVALSAAHLRQKPADARLGRDGDRRRNSRAGARQAGHHLAVSLERLERSARGRRYASDYRPRSGRSTRSPDFWSAPIASTPPACPIARSSTAAMPANWTWASKCPPANCRPSVRTSNGTKSTPADRADHSHRSTLVFVNTRRLAERVAHHLRELLGEGGRGSHHGSLSREIRQSAEQRLKRAS